MKWDRLISVPLDLVVTGKIHVNKKNKEYIKRLINNVEVSCEIV